MMRRALALARRGEGRVEPNPMVGCVIVRGDRVIGEGWHRRFGGPHAEIDALRRCTGSPRGATCYVTLEPCCHHGKTPPCTDALIAAGVRRVVAAMRDPFPRVAGGGLKALGRAGIRVDVGLLAEEAAVINAPFLKWVVTGRPWVILKWAQSLDGKIAPRDGASRWITSAASRREAHLLRGRVDAVMVGIGTVLSDDPMLTCRDAPTRRTAARVVLDSRLRTPLRSKLVRTSRRIPTLIFTSVAAPAARRRALESAGCEIVTLRGSKHGLSLTQLLDELGQCGMTNVMVEGGGRLLGACFDAGLADEVVAFVAPRLIGGAAAPGPLDGRGVASMSGAHLLRMLKCRPCGPDQMWRARLK